MSCRHSVTWDTLYWLCQWTTVPPTHATEMTRTSVSLPATDIDPKVQIISGTRADRVSKASLSFPFCHSNKISTWFDINELTKVQLTLDTHFARVAMSSSILLTKFLPSIRLLSIDLKGLPRFVHLLSLITPWLLLESSTCLGQLCTLTWIPLTGALRIERTLNWRNGLV
jgi:hypothetical protein